MGAGGIEAMVYVSNLNEDHSIVRSWSDCATLSDSYKSDTLRMVQLIAISIYSINEIIYSIVVIRLFVSNILKLSIYCRENMRPDHVGFVSLFKESVYIISDFNINKNIQYSKQKIKGNKQNKR